MLTLYKQSANTIARQRRQQWLFEARLNFFVSEIMYSLDIGDADEIAAALKRTFEACYILEIPLERNFKKVYCFDGQNLIADWKVSALAHYLLVINCNPSNKHVAKAQLYYAMHKSSQ